MRKLVVGALLSMGTLLMTAGQAFADNPLVKSRPALGGYQFDEEEGPWVEAKVQLPEPPQEANWRSFYVSETASNRFYLDTASLSVGEDGVVRYTVMALSKEGVRNIAFYGMRCQSREIKVYALGRRDGSWASARGAGWVKISDGSANRYQAALFTDLFCPGGVVVRNAEDALQALRKGGHEPVWRSW